MPAVLKLKCQEEVRRVKLAHEEIKYEDVLKLIREAWPEVVFSSLKYLDDDGDLCTLCGATFSDFLDIAPEISGQKVLKLQLGTSPASDSKTGKESLPIESHAAVQPKTKEQPQNKFEFQPEASAEVKSEEPHPEMKQTEANPQQSDTSPSVEAKMDDVACPWKASEQFWSGYKQHAALHGCGGAAGNQDTWLLRPRVLIWMLSQLRSSGALSSKTVASMVVVMMPTMVSRAVEMTKEIDLKLKEKLPDILPSLEGLRGLVARTPGLENCEAKIGALISDESASLSEALIQLFTALSDLSFDVQIAFVEEFYNSQEDRLHQILDKADTRIPSFAKCTVEHRATTCDGCNKNPLPGLRFKCKTCSDYDLCAECFAKMSSLHSGENAGHEFELIAFDGHWGKKHHDLAGPLGAAMAKGAWAVKMAMKGMCGKDCGRKGEGKGNREKGKCKRGKGEHMGMDSCGKDPACCPSESVVTEPRSCASGCGFQATWHPTHCCHACAMGAAHGPICQRKPMPAGLPTDAREPEAPKSETVQEQKDAANAKAPTHMAFPVEVGDGRKLTIGWEHGDDPQQVAESFGARHGILPDELATIVEFVQHATAMSESQSAGKANEADVEVTTSTKDLEKDKSNDVGSDAVIQEAAKTLEEMGFGDADVLCNLLQNVRGDLQAAIEILTR